MKQLERENRELYGVEPICGNEVLTVVEHDQDLPRRQVFSEYRGGRATLFDQAERFAAGEGDGIGLANDREIDQRGTVRHRVLEATRDLDRQGGQ